MTAEAIREMQWSNRAMEYENLFNVLREIAAQLADLNERLGQVGPLSAPTPGVL